MSNPAQQACWVNVRCPEVRLPCYLQMSIEGGFSMLDACDIWALRYALDICEGTSVI